MLRGRPGRRLIGACFCGGIAIVIAWLIIVTIVYSLIIFSSHDDLDETVDLHNKNKQRICIDIENISGNATEFFELFTSFRPCIDEFCDPRVFPRITDAIRCLNCWDANANDPPLVSSVGNAGDLYIVCVSGTTTLNGISVWAVNNILLFVDDETRWARVDSVQTDLTDVGPDTSLITDGTGNAIAMATITGEGDFSVTRIGDKMEFEGIITPVPSQVRDYNKPPLFLTNETQLLNTSNGNSSGVFAPLLISEHWTRSGDILEAFIIISFKPDSIGLTSVTIGLWPDEIVSEFGGLGNTSTVTRNSVTCSLVLTNMDQSNSTLDIQTVINIIDQGCFVNEPPSSPGLAEDTELTLYAEYFDLPTAVSGAEEVTHNLWKITFFSVAPFS